MLLLELRCSKHESIMMSADALLFFALLYHHDAAAGFMSLIWQFSSLATSLLIRKLLQWYEDPAKPVAKGYTLALVSNMHVYTEL
jgi:hypothetical protein